jgi:ribosomal protein S18 acetylase RimI-like enzyme
VQKEYQRISKKHQRKQKIRITVNTTSRPDLFIVRRLYETAFPPDERRDFEELLRIADAKPAFHADIYRKETELSGFIFYWIFRDFVYVEYFAVAEQFRNQGYGKRLLQELFRKTNLPVVLEVEKPEDDIQRRRIRFYEKMGFQTSKIPYLQPAYGPNKKPVQMLLMYRGEVCLEKCAEEIKKEVYGQ